LPRARDPPSCTGGNGRCGSDRALSPKRCTSLWGQGMRRVVLRGCNAAPWDLRRRTTVVLLTSVTWPAVHSSCGALQHAPLQPRQRVHCRPRRLQQRPAGRYAKILRHNAELGHAIARRTWHPSLLVVSEARHAHSGQASSQPSRRGLRRCYPAAYRASIPYAVTCAGRTKILATPSPDYGSRSASDRPSHRISPLRDVEWIPRPPTLLNVGVPA
jgi:hypothetical protein